MKNLFTFIRDRRATKKRKALENKISTELFINKIEGVTQNMNDILSDWIFRYNCYTNKWETVTRDNYHALTSDRSKIISSPRIEVLIELISRTKGDAKEIEKLLDYRNTEL